jgi:hypothetical protein
MLLLSFVLYNLFNTPLQKMDHPTARGEFIVVKWCWRCNNRLKGTMCKLTVYASWCKLYQCVHGKCGTVLNRLSSDRTLNRTLFPELGLRVSVRVPPVSENSSCESGHVDIVVTHQYLGTSVRVRGLITEKTTHGTSGGIMIAFGLSVPDPTECARSDGNRVRASALKIQ